MVKIISFKNVLERISLPQICKFYKFCSGWNEKVYFLPNQTFHLKFWNITVIFEIKLSLKVL